MIVLIPDLCLFSYFLMENIDIKRMTDTLNMHTFLLLSITCSYTMGCLHVRGDNPRALASGLSYVQVHKHGITILYHLHLCRPCT